jgi:hypothetical protein
MAHSTNLILCHSLILLFTNHGSQHQGKHTTSCLLAHQRLHIPTRNKLRAARQVHAGTHRRNYWSFKRYSVSSGVAGTQETTRIKHTHNHTCIRCACTYTQMLLNSSIQTRKPHTQPIDSSTTHRPGPERNARAGTKSRPGFYCKAESTQQKQI